MLLHYLVKLKNQNICNSRACKTRFKCYLISSIQQIKEMPNVVKISAKINTMQNINNLRFVPSLSLTSLKLYTVGLSTIKHQHSKKLTRWIEDTWTKNTWKMQIVCKNLFTRGVQNAHRLHGHAWRHFLHWWTAVSVMTCRKSDHTTTKHSFSTLRTVNEQKAKCWYFAWC